MVEGNAYKFYLEKISSMQRYAPLDVHKDVTNMFCNAWVKFVKFVEESITNVCGQSTHWHLMCLFVTTSLDIKTHKTLKPPANADANIDIQSIPDNLGPLLLIRDKSNPSMDK